MTRKVTISDSGHGCDNKVEGVQILTGVGLIINVLVEPAVSVFLDFCLPDHEPDAGEEVHHVDNDEE